jgi:hypothetical protein
MGFKFRLADAMNTYNPALLVLRQKGYRVWVDPGDQESEGEDWRAEKDARDFVASDPLRLLGLITMWEHRGDGWQGSASEADLYDEIRSAAYPDPGGAI